ncbi:MAG: rRNA maturation RNase YbeY [Firmicutes bacterium]|nr:rRNA maturation RNase YbeY [Bacillota bacterium]
MVVIIDENEKKVFSNISKAATAVLKLEGRAIAELIIVSAEEMQKTNLAERGIDKVTDVLSFPMVEMDKIKPLTKENYAHDYDPHWKAICLGSILLCKEQVEKQAKEYGHSVEREEHYLVIHGLLHLFGFDHVQDGEDKKQMRKMEKAILKMAGIE